MSEWRHATIGDVAEVFDGPHATPTKTTTGPWFLSISSLDKGHLRLAESAHLSEDEFTRWTRRVVPREGDLLFSYETRLGEAALMPSGIRACLGRRMGLLRPRKDVINPRFLLYLFLSPDFQEVIRQRSVRGATVDRIPLVELPTWPVRLPPTRSEQDAIAAVLGALDDKIDANDRISRTADELGHAIFMATNAAASIQAAVGEVLDLKYGKALPAALRNKGDVAVFGSGGIIGEHDTALVDGPGVIVGRKGTVGSVHWSEMSFFPIDTTFYVETRERRIPMEFAYFLLANLGLGEMNSDSAVPGLNRDSVLGRLILLPTEERLASFSVQVRPLFALKHGLAHENRCLVQLRNALLPKLMSGEIRIREAEAVVEEAL